MSLKQSIKRPLLHAAAHFGPHRWPVTAPRLWVLMYHRVIPADAPEMQDAEPGMVVTPETLSMHLSLLSRWAEPVFLDDWLERKNANKPLPRRAVAVTFDDGWSDNYHFAYPALRSHQFPASIFLVSDWIDTQQIFWPERLARILRIAANGRAASDICAGRPWLATACEHHDFSRPPSREALSSIFARCKHLPDLDLHHKLDDLSAELEIPTPETRTLMTWEQVHQMQDSGNIRFGSHTCRHVRLNHNIDDALTHHEIATSKSTLEKQLGRKVNIFCYPNGDHTQAAVAEVQKHYLGAVTTQRGYNNLTSAPHLLNRVGIHNDVTADPVSFMARLSCWF